ncbi:DNA cytosine methyltransferase [Rhodanobacter sp. AS-Z3]|uniref:DNA cytosine methyltransferase n=1 Tax=Rhodanobacter sp. AS-Z3 TaxID=3031330 RepID=UPI00247A7E93|nr:DNA cytosine methyltransferase [Rhodanobacter sp. AS-Z3]WEN13670.1 DNA cytosine methyltransferase [Rhodanobacter sp. AS-Z3]
MADGTQHGFNFPRQAFTSALRPGEIVLDFFAGGGGASEALRQALGRDPDMAVNHDPMAIGLHAANHPFTHHMQADVWTVDILREVARRKVGWFHASPDCTHFSQAKGGQPRARATRSLSWVVLKVAGTLAAAGLAPRIISLENVEQILTWGPLVAKRCKTTGRVLKLDGSVASKGEMVSVWDQQLVPDKRHAGRTWSQFVAALRAIGYVVEWRKLVASDYGAGTIRKRLFLIARRDGQPIVWPAPTHGKAPGLLPLVTAADCIDFTVPCPSIFTRKKPLAEATMRRIAKGIQRYVIDAAEPFIVGCGGRMSQTSERGTSQPMQTITAKADSCLGTATLAPLITEMANASNQRTMPADEPLRTICAGVKGGHFAVVSPTLVGVGGRAAQTDQRPGNEPLITITSKADCAVVTAFLEQANGGGPNGNPARARGCDEPVSSVTATGSQQRLVTAHMAKLRGTSNAADVADPLATISAGGEHHALIECTLSPEHETGALRVAAFMVNYYGNGTALDLREPLDTITTRDRIALVTVVIHGTPYVIVDIGLRMLRREELFRAQGFPADYIIDRTASGQRLTISQSVRMVGNSVSPPPLCALARANLDPVTMPERIAA